MKYRFLLLTLLCYLVAGCSKEFREAFSDLFPLRDAIIEATGEKNVNVVIQNGTCIGVSFINSRFNSKSDS